MEEKDTRKGKDSSTKGSPEKADPVHGDKDAEALKKMGRQVEV